MVADDFVVCDDRKRAHVRCCTEALMRAEKTGTNECVSECVRAFTLAAIKRSRVIANS